MKNAAPALLPPAKRWLFRLTLIALPLLILAAIEGGLRWRGLGGLPPLMREIGVVDGRLLVELDWQGSASYFFSAHPGRGTSRQQSFFMPKPPGTLRIMLAGESAARGYPYALPLTAGSFLETMLEDVRPGTDVEVINMGTTAVASFPVYDMVRQAMPYQPDLVIVYAGNNEFFGSYGVASRHYAGSHPVALQLTRWLHRLGLVQWIGSRIRKSSSGPDGTLMEKMMREQHVAPDSRLRQRAVDNLTYHVERIIETCRDHGVPVMICTLAANEKDLAPIGSVEWANGPESDDEFITSRLAAEWQERKLDDEPDTPRLESLRERYPNDARVHFLLGRDYLNMQRFDDARTSLQAAIDLDPMPWRPIGAINDALRRVANEHGALLGDVQEAFRRQSPEGFIGWELMDDHVHPGMRGQFLLARTMVDALSRAPAPLGFDAEKIKELGDWESYAARLGRNPYEEIGAAMSMMALFQAPFFKQSNPQGYALMEKRVHRLAREIPADMVMEFDEALRREAMSGENNPVSGIAGLMLFQKGRFAEAEPLLEFTCRSLPPYAAIRRQFDYLLFQTRLNRNGRLDDADRESIRKSIRRGEVLLKYGGDPSGRAAFFMGRMYELLGDAVHAAYYLNASR